MGTKNKPGNFDCYDAAHPDEPMFVLLARDPQAPRIVLEWADRRETTRGPSEKVEEARDCAAAMIEWHAEYNRVQGQCCVCGKDLTSAIGLRRPEEKKVQCLDVCAAPPPVEAELTTEELEDLDEAGGAQ